MRRKSLVGLVLLAVGLLALAGTLSAAPKRIKVGVTLVTLADPFFASLQEGLLARAKEVGNVDLTIEDGQGDATKQFAQVEEFVAQKYDAIIINPSESGALVRAAEEAKKAGIPVITMDRLIDADYGPNGVAVAHVGADAVDGGKFGLRIVAEKLKAKYGTAKGNVLYIQGTPGSSTARDRTTGVTEELKKYPGMKILAQQPGETRDKAMSLTENWLQQYPNVDAIYAYGGDGALGAVQAADALGKLSSLIIVGTGAAKDELASIRDKRLFGTVDFNPVGTGRDGIDVILKILNKQAVAKWVRTEAKMVTQDNLTD